VIGTGANGVGTTVVFIAKKGFLSACVEIKRNEGHQHRKEKSG
jgi:hypothetical protein